MILEAGQPTFVDFGNVPKTVGDEMRKLSLSDAIAKGEAVVHHGMSSHEKASPNTE